MKKITECVCLVLYDENFKFLTVTRSDGQGIGLPGGKVEEGETLLQAARRELWEETGLYANEDDMLRIFHGPCNATDGFEVTTFFVTKWSGDVQQKEDKIVPKWMPFAQLLHNSPFASYNRSVGLSISRKLPYLTRHMGL